jgi:bifunctional non-homologous end joining protein LigD
MWVAMYRPAASCQSTTEKSCAAVRSAFTVWSANTHVARAKKAILQKKRTIGSGSSERTVGRQPFDVSEASGRIPTAPFPSFVAPMQAMLVDSIRSGDWIYEIKFDGYRAVALRSRNETRIISRNEKDLGGKFPEIKSAVSALGVQDAIIDGEIVALDDKGRSSFQLLQGFDMGLVRPPIVFYAFDLLRLNGKDLQGLPIEERKAGLEALLKKPPGAIRYSASFRKDIEELLSRVRALGLEGLIGKRTNSHYEAGKRSGAWVKIKLHRQQEFVIGGYTEPEGSRKHFGALLVGFYEGKNLKFAGRVGTGFSEKLLRSLFDDLQKIRVESCPFSNLPAPGRNRWDQGLTTAEMKRCRWVKPSMVCQVKFTEWTRDDRLRQAVFLGIREDKNSNDVVREKVN